MQTRKGLYECQRPHVKKDTSLRTDYGRLAKGRDGKEKKSCKRIPVSIDR